MGQELANRKQGNPATSMQSKRASGDALLAKLGKIQAEIVTEASLTITAEESELRLGKWQALAEQKGHEKFFKAMELWRSREKFLPHTTDLAKIIAAELEEQVKPFVGYNEEDRRLAKEAEGSPEEKSFHETLERVMRGTKLETIDRDKRKADLKKQAEKLK